MYSKNIIMPKFGEKITQVNGVLNIPDQPIIPFIEGDGIGVDITPVMMNVVDAAVEKAYAGSKKIAWLEVFAGEKATKTYTQDDWLPEETLDIIKEYHVAIKGPLTTPIGGGIRSLNVALRQKLDLYVCLRPIRYFTGTPSPLKHPEFTDMVIFRENSEGIYAGIEFKSQSTQAKKLIKYLQTEMQVTEIRFPESSGVGIKVISEEGTKRLVRQAIEYAIENNREHITLVHKGNIMKYTEGAFRDWGYSLAREEFGAVDYQGGPWQIMKNPNTGDDIIISDVLADAFFQQALLRPQDYDIIATMNLNGDYLSDALAAQVGGIGIAPGANLSDTNAVFEATHGTAPKYAGQNKVNPGSLILSAEMMLRHLHWHAAADCIIQGVSGAIGNNKVTYDLHRLMKNAQLCSCSEFGEAVIQYMS